MCFDYQSCFTATYGHSPPSSCTLLIIPQSPLPLTILHQRPKKPFLSFFSSASSSSSRASFLACAFLRASSLAWIARALLDALRPTSSGLSSTSCSRDIIVWVSVYVYVCVCVFTYMYMCIYMCVYVCKLLTSHTASCVSCYVFLLSLHISLLNSPKVTVGPALTLTALSTRGKPHPRHDHS